MPTIRILGAALLLAWAGAATGSADPLGRWIEKPPTPSVRTESSAALLDGKVYLVGGFTPKGITDRVDVLDLASGTWSLAAPLPRALHHTTVHAVNGKLYVIGGFHTGFWTPVDSTYEYDPDAD
ncbi:MAG: galactose oxidase, partial [Nitrospinaceae bacterium]|nr:galactose oxidase [Nitrospinaceae bacterium]NIS86201.1 galactose oxidase [Nitrospinaceae bacterium]